MTLIGFARSDFQLRDSDVMITGHNIYVSQAIPAEKGRGKSVERYYITDAKLDACGIDLSAALNKEVRVYINRFGKLDSLAMA